MGSFEKFKPQLRAGHTFAPHSSDGKLIFELEDGSQQVTLPHDADTILKLMDGSRSIQEIVEEVFRLGQRVRFKSLVSTIEKLKQHHCFLNQADAPESEFQTRPEIFDKSETWWERPLLSVTILRRWQLGRTLQSLFVLIANASLFIAVAFILDHLMHLRERSVFSSDFLKINDSYLQGVGFFLIWASLLVSTKTLYKALLSLLLIGRVSQMRVTLNFYSLSLRLHDEALYLSSRRRNGVLAAISVGISQFFIFALIASVFPNWAHLHDVFLVSLILVLIDLNPYRKSELTSFFNIVYNKDSVAHLLPYLKSRSLLAIVPRDQKVANETIYAAYSTLAIAWTLAAFNLGIGLLNHNFANLLSSIMYGQPLESIAAGVIFLGICVTTAYLVFDLGRTVLQNFLPPLLAPILRLRAQHQAQPPLTDLTQTMPRLLELPIFANVRPPAIRFLIDNSFVRSYKKGRTIIRQDTSSTELFLLLSGEVVVRKRHPTGGVTDIATLRSTTAFGENTLLENRPRSADVVAKTNVTVIAIPRDALDQLSKNSEFLGDHESIIDRLRLGQYISASELFRDAPSEAVGLFLNQGEIMHVPQGQRIIGEGQNDKDFFLLIRGAVQVETSGRTISRLTSGDFFGEMALLLNRPRSAHVTTLEECTLLKLSAERFWQVIAKHLSLAVFLETISEMRRNVIDEKMTDKGLRPRQQA